MAYSETLADRIRDSLAGPDLSERKMFGGICFMLRGNMTAGVVGDSLMLRLGEERADAALDEPHTRPMDFTGRPMKNMVYVDPPGIATDEQLESWLDRAKAFALSLPAK